MSKYDWSDVPHGENWIATDADGTAWGWETEPQLFEDDLEWNTCESFVGNHFIAKENNPFKGDWRDSLEKRPCLTQ